MTLNKSKSASELNKGLKITDSNSPLHLIQPDYGFLYGIPSIEDISIQLNQILQFLDEEVPIGLEDKLSGDQINDFSKISENTIFKSGGFRLISYELGVLYGSMLKASDVLKNKKFGDFTIKRLNFIVDICVSFMKVEEANKSFRSPVYSVLHPASLDDAGAMCAALIKTNKFEENKRYLPLIENFVDYVCNKQFRFSDGTFARNRPYSETLWIDDLFMSVSMLSQMGSVSGNNKFFDEAVKQVVQFSDRMFNRDVGLFTHGWLNNANYRPKFYWGRANGWALLAMTELLEVLPVSYDGRDAVMNLFHSHLKGLAGLQSKSGFWFQLLDKSDSYVETSATAIYTYCIAKAINMKWISASEFGPMCLLAWNAISSKINNKGHIEGICVGTGMGFEPMFYYHRPVNIYAAHGYGPTILAGAEIIRLIESHHIEIYDGALLFEHYS